MHQSPGCRSDTACPETTAQARTGRGCVRGGAAPSQSPQGLQLPPSPSPSNPSVLSVPPGSRGLEGPRPLPTGPGRVEGPPPHRAAVKAVRCRLPRLLASAPRAGGPVRGLGFRGPRTCASCVARACGVQRRRGRHSAGLSPLGLPRFLLTALPSQPHTSHLAVCTLLQAGPQPGAFFSGKPRSIVLNTTVITRPLVRFHLPWLCRRCRRRAGSSATPAPVT